MSAHQFKVVQHIRETDKPGVFGGGTGYEEMRAGDVTYIVVHCDTGLSFKNCSREPYGLWIDPEMEIREGANWVRDKEQTAAAYDWFERIQ